MPSRADLSFQDLQELHQPLPEPERVEQPTAKQNEPKSVAAPKKPAQPAASATFRSLERPRKEMLTSLTIRIPVSMAQRLETVCSKNTVDRSALVRDFIDNGLSIVESGRS